MPECHKCKHNGTSSQVCITCRGPAKGDNHHGRTHVSFDSSDAVDCAAVLNPFDQAECIELSLDDCCQDAVRRLLSVFADLPPDDISLVCHILNSKSLASWGDSNGLTRQAVSYRFKRLISQHKELAALLV